MTYLRFIDTGVFSGSVNMAIDEVISNSLFSQPNHLCLRFYKWNPPTISFGYNQKIERLVNLDAAKKHGCDIVKRMTGGKMVYHNLEITFFIGITDSFIESKVGKKLTFLEKFCFAMENMIIALNKIEVPARFSSPFEVRNSHLTGIHCYAASAGHSIYADNRKLIGAAGVYKKNCLTIHGSIPIRATFPPSDIFIDPSKISQKIDMAELEEYCSPQTIDKLPEIVANTYSENFEIELSRSLLSMPEKISVQELSKNKYSNPNWL